MPGRETRLLILGGTAEAARLAKAGTLLGIPLLDHVVVGVDGFASFRDRGVL